MLHAHVHVHVHVTYVTCDMLHVTCACDMCMHMHICMCMSTRRSSGVPSSEQRGALGYEDQEFLLTRPEATFEGMAGHSAPAAH